MPSHPAIIASAYCSAPMPPSAAASDRAARTKKTDTIGPRLWRAASRTWDFKRDNYETHLPPTESRKTFAIPLNASEWAEGRKGAAAIRA
jgi:hypothetical protein